MVKRVTVYASCLVLLVSVWVGLLGLMERNVIDKDTWGRMVYVLPWFALVTLGCYCLGKLGIDLLTFNDCPHEISLLEADIAAAEADLKARGFTAS